MRTDFPRNHRDICELGDLLGRVFHVEAARSKQFPERFAANPAIRPKFQRILRVRGRIVAHVGIHEKILRVGRARLRMAGIAGVACDPRYRRRGLAAACMKDALDLLLQDGMPLSLLYGIESYYLRFGYVGCLPIHVMHLGLKQLQPLRGSLRVTPHKQNDLEDLLRLYNAAAESTPASVVRDTARMAYALRNWEGNAESPSKISVFRERRGAGRVRAYVIWDKGALVETAVHPGDEKACTAVLAWLRDQRRETFEKDVLLSNLCPAHPLWRHAERYTHRTERELRWTRSGMGRPVCVAAFLEALRPEFEARVNSAGLESECHLHLIVDGKEHSLILGRAHHLSLSISTHRLILSSRVECSSQALAQMALGTLAYDRIPGVRVEGERSLLRAVFPESCPHLYRLDHF